MAQSLRVKLIVVGKTKIFYLQQGIDDFLTRLSHYARVQLIVVKAVAGEGKYTDKEILTREGENLLKKIAPDNYVVVLDRQGKQLDSEQFAQFFADRVNKGQTRIAFLIGGELGLSEAVRQKANLVLSLSAMTFTHDMTRLILSEQIYRVMTILHGEPYHK